MANQKHEAYQLVGKRIGNVTVLRDMGCVNKRKQYLVKCSCGNLHRTNGKTLVCKGLNNTDYSCPKCTKNPTRKNMFLLFRSTNDRVLSSWDYMIKQCYKPTGILKRTICPEWFDFFKFLKDMGEPKHNDDVLVLLPDVGEYNKKTTIWMDKSKFLSLRSRDCN